MLYDYEDIQKILDSFNNTKIMEKEPLGYTFLEHLPIRYFTFGSGTNDIIVIASQHASEIISTTFCLKLMQYLITNNIEFKNTTIHFIPILNPEGYLINTQAIKSKLTKNISLDNFQKFCYEYYLKFRYDIYHNEKIKLHQVMFADINSKVIPSYYPLLKDSVSNILSNHPKGSIIDWTSNGNGIDLNSNSNYKIVKEYDVNKSNAYNNIRLDIPSPIGYPGNNTKLDFKQEREIESLNKLLKSLNNIKAIFNYHSTGGIIYQRPENNTKLQIIYNYLLSKFYQNKNINSKCYDIIQKPANIITSVNDLIRRQYLGDLLIELSPMMGNPIGVYGDLNNFERTITYNIQSFITTLNNLDLIFNTSIYLNNATILDNNLYSIIDNVYEKIRKK